MLKRGFIFKLLFLLYAAVLVISALVSCSKTDTATPTGSNVRLQVVQLSPDSYPVSLYLNSDRINPTTTYRYGSTPSYFYLPRTDGPLQIRTTRVIDTLVFTTDTVKFAANTRYSLFFMGLYANRPFRTLILPDDAEELPAVGKGGKIRFLNGSPNSNAVDVWANGARITTSTDFAKVSPYVTLPPGNYNFRVYQATTSTNSLGDLPNVTIQDGRLYTLYSRGLVGRAATDTAAFALAVLANNPTIK
jgi:hypothetical protein